MSDAKSEVFAAYEEFLGKLKTTQKATITKISEINEEKNLAEKNKVVSDITRETPDTVSKHFSGLQQFISDIERKLAAEQEKLRKTEQAAETSKRELEEMYSIKTNVDTLATLLLTQKEKTAQFEKEIAQRRQEWAQEEQAYMTQRELAREAERAEYEAMKRGIEQRERQLQEEARLAVEQERQRIEQEIRARYEYDAKLARTEMEHDRLVLTQTIATLEAKIAHLESLKYSFSNQQSFNVRRPIGQILLAPFKKMWVWLIVLLAIGVVALLLVGGKYMLDRAFNQMYQNLAQAKQLKSSDMQVTA
jgi:hypothetical protein